MKHHKKKLTSLHQHQPNKDYLTGAKGGEMTSRGGKGGKGLQKGEKDLKKRIPVPILKMYHQNGEIRKMLILLFLQYMKVPTERAERLEGITMCNLMPRDIKKHIINIKTSRLLSTIHQILTRF